MGDYVFSKPADSGVEVAPTSTGARAIARGPKNPWEIKPYKPPKFGATKPIKPEPRKNPYQAASNRQLAIEALGSRRCLAFTYEDLHRICEVHTVGVTRADRPAMSVFQVDGQTEEGALPDWRMFCFDQCFDVCLADRPSAAPRADYRKGAKQFSRIDAEA